MAQTAYTVIGTAAIIGVFGLTYVFLLPIWEGFMSYATQAFSSIEGWLYVLDLCFTYSPLACVLGIILYNIASGIDENSY